MATYPVITLREAQRFVQSARDNHGLPVGQPSVEIRSFEYPDAPSLEVDQELQPMLHSFAATFLAQKSGYSSSQQKKDILEGLLVEPLHAALRALPPAVLTDRDFWRWLSVGPLFEFAKWRDSKEGMPGDITFGCSAQAPHPDTLALRMFNRGEISVRAAGEAGDPYEVARIPGSDMWKSHILRTLNRYAPVTVSEIAREVKSEEMNATVLRDMIKRIKRVRANVLLEVLDDQDASDFVSREHAAADEKVGGGSAAG